MDAVMEFLRMGGYAAFVWPAYGLTVLVMGGMLGLTLKGLRARRRELQAFEAVAGPRRERRRANKDTETGEP